MCVHTKVTQESLFGILRHQVYTLCSALFNCAIVMSAELPLQSSNNILTLINAHICRRPDRSICSNQ